ncbi:MAG: hypothetical protein B6D39_10110 [Anaerolineae bacterium UTCFX2]|jgi:hypothetical protein|nr:MAG: hypothetical protein B6D39_10110 [Anaerolineae bacterium UTCFX2]
MVFKKIKTIPFRWAFFGLIVLLVMLITWGDNLNANAQIPTGSIPTVTGTPFGAIAIVLDNEQGFINVRGGPNAAAYDIVGVLVEGSQVPALGRSPGGEWIQIAYPGVPGGVAWVWSDLLEVRGALPVIEPPPTQTPRVTATIDPTLAAQFLVEVPPTRLPTFTEPPPLVQPTFPVDAPIATQGKVPMGLVIIGMAIIGIFGTLLSLLRGR